MIIDLTPISGHTASLLTSPGASQDPDLLNMVATAIWQNAGEAARLPIRVDVGPHEPEVVVDGVPCVVLALAHAGEHTVRFLASA